MGYLLAFLTLFAAIDVVAVLPIYHGLTGGAPAAEKRRIVLQSCLTAFFVAVGFALLGRVLFRLLGIEVYDFKVAGGLLLLIFSIQDLTAREKARRSAAATATLGVVPLGMPLIVGPAVLTTIVILLDTYGYPATLAALVLNLAIVWVALSAAERLLGLIGEAGALALGKVASLILAAIAIMMMRRGLTEMVAALGRG